MKVLPAAVTVFMLAGLVVAGQQPSPAPRQDERPRAQLAGRVLDDGSGEPVPNARVRLAVTSLGVPLVVTGDDGRFSLTVPAGRQAIVATKAGYGPTQVLVDAGTANLDIRLKRGASISGRVTNEIGEPVVAAFVTVQSGDTRESIIVRTETNDRGEYRIGGLRAGTFAVSVRALQPRVMAGALGAAYPAAASEPVYVAGIPRSRQANALPVDAGEERTGIDFFAPAADRLVIGAGPARSIVSGPMAFPRSVKTSAVVRGRVLDINGRPIVRALVQMFRDFGAGSGPGAVTRSDEGGRFEFRNLVTGRFRVEAERIGYFPSGEPEGMAPSRSFDLADGVQPGNLEIRLMPWGAIEGRIVDERGDPLDHVAIRLMQVRYEAGRRALLDAHIRAPITNDRGEYRLYGVPPGRYVVSAAIADAFAHTLPGYARAFFPGSSDPAHALYTSVTPGASLAGVDLAMTRERTIRISGRTFSPLGEPATGGVRLVPGSGSVVGLSFEARTENESFEFANVPAGEYVLQFSAAATAATAAAGFIESDFVAMPLHVGNDDITDLVVQARSGSQIRGRVIFNGAALARNFNWQGIEVTTVPVDPLLAPSRLAASRLRNVSTFELHGISGARRVQIAGLPPEWALERIRIEGLDVTDDPVVFGTVDRPLDMEVVLTDRVSTLTGIAAADGQAGIPGAHIVAYSTDRGRWYWASRFMSTTTADDTGSFAIRGLPSGTYYVAAVSRLPPEGPNAWQNPEFLSASTARATTVSITEGSTTSVRVRLQ